MTATGANLPRDRTLRARELRRNPTDAERRLWHRLRQRNAGGYKFRRQFPVGPYFADFACIERHLVVEVDGGQHAEKQAAYDRKRDAWLAAHGWRVLRVWDHDVLQRVDAVLDAIYEALEDGRVLVFPSQGKGP